MTQKFMGTTLLSVRKGNQVALGGDGQVTSIVTSMFLHGGWFHIIGNMWFLWVFGDNVEDVMGPVRFVVFYLLCGLGAAAAQVLGAVEGMSGAVAQRERPAVISL